MFQKSEIRQNNYLNYKCQETGELLPSKLDHQDIEWISERFESFNQDHSPIQISEDFLRKCPEFIFQNSQECSSDNTAYTLNIGKFLLKAEKSNDYKSVSVYLNTQQGYIDTGLEFFYVHDLQNWYYYTANKNELTITLNP